MKRVLALAAGLLLPLGLAELRAATVTTVIGTGAAGLSDAQVANPYGVVVGPDGGPEDDPLRCRLARPHGIFHEPGRGLYVGDSEAHRIRLLAPR